MHICIKLGMGHRCCSKQKVKRGLWSPEEDEKLVKYITTHGHGSWSSVPKLAGLQRCGKSCRLRWINYLRPDLKRGSFTAQEEQIIIDVHRILGNRWAQIAKHLPGRTDNEVKNFWNSCIKKKLISQGLDPRTHNLIPAHQRSSKSSSSSNINISLPISHPHQQPFSIISVNGSSQMKDNPLDTLISPHIITSNNTLSLPKSIISNTPPPTTTTSVHMPKYSLEHQNPHDNVIWDTQLDVPVGTNHNIYPWTPSCMDNITLPNISTPTLISDNSLANNTPSGYGLLSSEGISCMWGTGINALLPLDNINDHNNYNNGNDTTCNIDEEGRQQSTIVSLERGGILQAERTEHDQVNQQPQVMLNNNNNMEVDDDGTGDQSGICLLQEMGVTNSFDSSGYDMEFVDSTLLITSSSASVCRDLTSMDDLAWNF